MTDSRRFNSPRQYWRCPTCGWTANWTYFRSQGAHDAAGQLEDGDIGLLLAEHIATEHSEQLQVVPTYEHESLAYY